jgi:hypothetical protein
MKGKPWGPEQEKQLRELVESKMPLDVVAVNLGLSVGAVKKKCGRLGLEVVVPVCRKTKTTTTTAIKLPAELPSVEDALRKLAGALETACQPGLDNVEVQRLQVVAVLARTYKDILSAYMNYRGLEAELMELRVKYAEFSKKSSGVQPK